MADPAAVKTLASLSGEGFLAIQHALAEWPAVRAEIGTQTMTVTYHRDDVSVMADRDIATSKDSAASYRKVIQRDVLGTHDCPVASRDSVPPIVQDMIAGRHLLAIERATPILLAKGLPLACYRINLLQDANAIVVTFIDVAAQSGSRGAGGTRPGLEVELSLPDLRVISMQFVR